MMGVPHLKAQGVCYTVTKRSRIGQTHFLKTNFHSGYGDFFLSYATTTYLPLQKKKIKLKRENKRKDEKREESRKGGEEEEGPSRNISREIKLAKQSCIL